ncbi:hypothetical protein F0L74_09310 [Chitinophaga agrisoli]|uniref:Uncharacterized protein n=1 Tax=Chitinophaga agrisoli TaxID=2607653 RepID=A0A5B2VUH4_9BACT|nr:hypothetical protein [Chitinophaga agrisoli]KAA2242715.1 hypothetical protein F0L74_09310 [Chitinophaga agrisoli]
MEHIQELIQAGNIDEAIRQTEAKLSQLPPTDFHQVIGKDLLHHASSLGAFLSIFYDIQTKEEELDIKAIYVELNSFTTQFDRWFLHLLGYESLFSRDNLDWLTDFSAESDKSITITGYEALQEANKRYMQSEGYRDDLLREACELHEYLVILRLHQLVQHTVAAHKDSAWAAVTVFAAAHDYEDLMYTAK